MKRKMLYLYLKQKFPCNQIKTWILWKQMWKLYIELKTIVALNIFRNRISQQLTTVHINEVSYLERIVIEFA